MPVPHIYDSIEVLESSPRSAAAWVPLVSCRPGLGDLGSELPLPPPLPHRGPRGDCSGAELHLPPTPHEEQPGSCQPRPILTAGPALGAPLLVLPAKLSKLCSRFLKPLGFPDGKAPVEAEFRQPGARRGSSPQAGRGSHVVLPAPPVCRTARTVSCTQLCGPKPASLSDRASCHSTPSKCFLKRMRKPPF